MIGGYSGPFKGNIKGNPRNHEINNALTFDNTNLRVKGNVHTNGAIFMDNQAAVTLEHLSSAAKLMINYGQDTEMIIGHII